MSTTTICIEVDLKAQLAAAAQVCAKTGQAFIWDAYAQAVEQAENDAEFEKLADDRWANLRATGRTVPWDEAKNYLEAPLRGDKTRRPAGRKSSR